MNCLNPYDEIDGQGVLWNINTGSGYAGSLTALRLTSKGNLLDNINVKNLDIDN